MKVVKMPQNYSDEIEYCEELENNGLYFAYTKRNQLIGVVVWIPATGFAIECLSGGLKLCNEKEDFEDSIEKLYDRLLKEFPGAILKYEETTFRDTK